MWRMCSGFGLSRGMLCAKCSPCTLLLACFLCMAAGADITGTITATATSSYDYGTNVVTAAHMEKVICRLTFSEDVFFNSSNLSRAPTTRIWNFTNISKGNKREYRFLVDSTINGKVNLHIPAGGARSVTTNKVNSANTAEFSFQYTAFSPSATVSLDGFTNLSTNRLSNVAYITFNISTQPMRQGPALFTSSHVSFLPNFTLTGFNKINDFTFRVAFAVRKSNASLGATRVRCIRADDPSNETSNGTSNETSTTTTTSSTTTSTNGTSNVTSSGPTNYSRYTCDRCTRSQHCETAGPFVPWDVLYVEFPFSLVLTPDPRLGVKRLKFPIVYDTLWALVQIKAPTYARDAFPLTVTWSEPLTDLTKVKPVFVSGPPVDQDVLKNITVTGPRSFIMMVKPLRTGVVKIRIAGSSDSSDLATNRNNVDTRPFAKSESEVDIIFSAGPPLEGTVSFSYVRPRFTEEYPVVRTNQSKQEHNLIVSWSNFFTATRYDVWVTWGKSLKSEMGENISGTSHVFTNFVTLFGTSYTVHIRARNVWGQAIVATMLFLPPAVNLDASGKFSVIQMPDLLGPLQTKVKFHVVVPKDGFLSMNALQVLRMRDVNLTGGDRDPCLQNSRDMSCSFMNFHIEVPKTGFVVFRRPIRLQLTFGEKGWLERDFRPKLLYWEIVKEQWRNASTTCPPDQVYDNWNAEHKVYEVSLCHLTQFAIFSQYDPIIPPPAIPEAPRPKSYEDPLFFVILAASVVVCTLMGCVVYWLCVHNSSRSSAIKYSDLGIKSTAERFPRYHNRGVMPETGATPFLPPPQTLPPPRDPPPSSLQSPGAVEEEPVDPVSLTLALEDDTSPDHDAAQVIPAAGHTASSRPAPGAGIGDLDEDEREFQLSIGVPVEELDGAT